MEITKLEIDESAKTFLRLPWHEREKRFQSLEKDFATSAAGDRGGGACSVNEKAPDRLQA